MDGSTIVGKDQVLIMSSTAKCFSEFKYSSDDPLLHGVDVLTESEPSSGQAHYRHLLSDKVRITPELFRDSHPRLGEWVKPSDLMKISDLSFMPIPRSRPCASLIMTMVKDISSFFFFGNYREVKLQRASFRHRS